MRFYPRKKTLSQSCNKAATWLPLQVWIVPKTDTLAVKLMQTATARFGVILGMMLIALSAHSQSADALIDKLVEKGILTVKEANDLREETEKNFSQAYSVKSGMSDWVSALKFNGDFRGRYEGHYSENDNFVDRHRLRYRIRFGAVATLFDNLEVGLRLGSGDPVSGFSNNSGNPLSGSSTFQDNASRKFIYVDLAYGKWTVVNNSSGSATLSFGKIELPFAFTHIVFDPDYNPEGFAAQGALNLSDKHSLKFNGGVFVLDELSASSHDPYLFGAQMGLDSVWSPKLSTTLGVALLNISHAEVLNNSNIPNVNRGNTRDTNGAPVANFNPVIADGWLTYNLDAFPAYSGVFPIRVGGEYLFNPAADNKNSAFAAGVTFGKAGKKGLWELVYQYRYLEADSWFEEFADDDFGGFYQAQQPNAGFTSASNPQGAGFGGGTNVKGHYVKVSYSLYDSLTVGLTYYHAWLIDESPAGSKSGAGHLMADLIWRF
jgi:hypothetical protein